MKRKITILLLFLPFLAVKAQVLYVDNGLLFSKTTLTTKDVCSHMNHAVLLSFDYFEMKKTYYITTQVGFYNTGYYAYQYNYLGHLVDNKFLKSHDLHMSLTLRRKFPVNKVFIYAGLGPKLDYSFNYKTKIVNENNIVTHTYPNFNTFRNMFGAKFDLGAYLDITKQYRVGINTSFSTNFGNGDKLYTHRMVCGVSIGYNFKR